MRGMKGFTTTIVLGLAAVVLTPASASTAITSADSNVGSFRPGSPAAPPLLQCVPYARQITGITIYGDAHTWWGKAAGRYARGDRPKVGAVLAIEPHANSRLGHVAAVSKIVDSRTILVSHANWSVPGKIERNVTVLDVSPRNDWSEVRVWYGPNRNLGQTRWPVAGFIYNAPAGKKPDKGSETRAAVSKAEIRAEPRLSRKRDPIGAIIAGRY